VRRSGRQGAGFFRQKTVEEHGTVIAGKLKLYFNGSWTRLDTSYEILLKVVVDNGSDVDNATTDHVLSGVWRFEFSRSFPRRWTRLGVLEYSRIFPRRKLDTSSFSVGRLSNFFTRRPRSLLISDFLAKVAQGWQDLLPCYPHSKLGDIWSTNPPYSATFVWTTPTVIHPASDDSEFFSHVDLGLS